MWNEDRLDDDDPGDGRTKHFFALRNSSSIRHMPFTKDSRSKAP
jgi:hypothetical protein